MPSDLATQALTGTVPQRLRHLGGWVLTLCIALLSWVPFRSEGLGQTFEMFGQLFRPAGYGWLGLRENAYIVTATLLIVSVAAYWLWTSVAPLVRRRLHGDRSKNAHLNDDSTIDRNRPTQMHVSGRYPRQPSHCSAAVVTNRCAVLSEEQRQ